MRSFLRSLLAFVTLGMLPLGCGKSDKSDKSDASVAATDVTLLVPAMN